nr:MAG TPA: Cell cycle protein [Bacteriophage sp.]
MEIIDVDYTEVPDDPITETWYTCPSCGCLTHTGEVCSCGYHPPVDVPVQAPVKKRLPSIIIAALVLALACSVFYNAVQASEKADLAYDRSQVDAEIASYQKEIQDYKDAISSAREQNMYLKEDLSHLCRDLPVNFSDSEFRHNFRNSSHYYEGTIETVSYWWRIELDYGDFFQ